MDNVVQINNPNVQFTVVYTEQELQALTQLIDIALKAGGLSVSAMATVLHQKHVAAVQAAQVAANTPQEG